MDSFQNPLNGFKDAKAVIAYVKQTYGHRPIGVQLAILKVMLHGHFGGTGKIVVGAFDQPDGVHNVGMYADMPQLFTPDYAFRLFHACQVSAIALHPENIAAIPDELRLSSGLPVLYKINAQDGTDSSILPTIVGTVDEAVRLGCSIIGYTLNHSSQMQELKAICDEAHAKGLCVAVWAYPRGKHLIDKDGYDCAQALDVGMTAVRQAKLAGADIIKAKPTLFLVKSKIDGGDDHKLILKPDLLEKNFKGMDLTNPKVRAKSMKDATGGYLLVPSGGEPGFGDARPASEEKWLKGLTETAAYCDLGAIGRYLSTQVSIEVAVKFMETGILPAVAAGWNNKL